LFNAGEILKMLTFSENFQFFLWGGGRLSMPLPKTNPTNPP